MLQHGPISCWSAESCMEQPDCFLLVSRLLAEHLKAGCCLHARLRQVSCADGGLHCWHLAGQLLTWAAVFGAVYAGTLPAEWAALKDCTGFELSGNKLTGERWWSYCPEAPVTHAPLSVPGRRCSSRCMALVRCVYSLQDATPSLMQSNPMGPTSSPRIVRRAVQARCPWNGPSCRR